MTTTYYIDGLAQGRRRNRSNTLLQKKNLSRGWLKPDSCDFIQNCAPAGLYLDILAGWNHTPFLHQNHAHRQQEQLF
jgi:hypothetical protein